MSIRMVVLLRGKQIVVESNPAWAVPYWTERQRMNPEANITWRIEEA